MVRTTTCGTGGRRFASSALKSAKPLLRREVVMQCSATSPSNRCFIGSGSASYAARGSANSVWPPTGATVVEYSSEHRPGRNLNELSVCHSRLPALYWRWRLSSSQIFPPGERLEMSANRWSIRWDVTLGSSTRSFSSGPNRLANAMWSSAARRCSRKISTAYFQNAALISAKSASDSAARFASPTSATKLGVTGNMERAIRMKDKRRDECFKNRPASGACHLHSSPITHHASSSTLHRLTLDPVVLLETDEILHFLAPQNHLFVVVAGRARGPEVRDHALELLRDRT